MNLSAHSPIVPRPTWRVRPAQPLRVSWGLSQRLPRWCAFDGVGGFFTTEGNVSERNGDKARYHRERKRKILRRTRIRELRKALEHNKAALRVSS